MEGLWETIPSDLLNLILERLPVPDYLRFAGVCSSWRQVQQDHYRRRFPSTCQMPWLMLPECQNSPHWRRFYSLSEERYYRLPIPPIEHGYHLCGTSHGWLIFLKDGNSFLFLVNPFTGSKIHITVSPSLVPVFSLQFGALSSSPMDPECILMLWNSATYLFCRIRDNIWTAWTRLLVIPLEHIRAIPLIIGGKIFRDVQGSKIHVVEPLPLLVETLHEMVGKLPSEKDINFFVESDGEILLVSLILEQDNYNRFEVFKADLCRMVWVRLESLGDRVLFLGFEYALCLSTVSTGGQGNKIYFSWSMNTIPEVSGPTWIEYDYGSGQFVSRELLDWREHVEDSFVDESLYWVMPSLR